MKREVEKCRIFPYCNFCAPSPPQTAGTAGTTRAKEAARTKAKKEGPVPENTAEKQKEGVSLPDAHARGGTPGAAGAYENFLARHDGAVRRIRNRADKDEP